MGKINSTTTHLHSALVLSGGGARAAYQVGVLKAIADIMPEATRNPFGIICGTSAGAINATALAANADNFRNAVYNIENVWRSFRPEHVYRADPVGVFSHGLKWLMTLILGMRGESSMLDSRPLGKLLKQMIRFEHIQQAIDAGHLRALAVTASGYNSGHSVAFFQGAPDISAWKRFQRVGMRSHLGVEHLMASSAIPIVFPAVRINREYFGDGAVRQLAPISPALHLGARKVLVVGVSGNRSAPQLKKSTDEYPSMAQITGHLMNSVFLDSLEYDVERLEHVNNMLRVFPDSVRRKTQAPMNLVESLIISPSQGLDRIAAKYLHVLPLSIRVFLHGIGATRSSGSSVLSYLLFERAFCRELIELGYQDGIAKSVEIEAFMQS